MRTYRLLAFFLVLTIASLACGVGSGPSSADLTAQAISTSVLATGTAEASQGQAADSAAQTAQAIAESQSKPAQLTATAEAFAPRLAELPKYGVDPAEGRLGWVHPPVTLDASGYRQFEYINYFIGTVATDFVVSMDITWDIVGSIAGCGFVLRSDGNTAALNQYMVIMTRVASGHVLFATMANGEVVTYQDIYARYKDKSFSWENLATNRLTVVGRGTTFYIYTNDTLIGEVDPTQPPKLPILPPEPEKPANANDAQAMQQYRQNKEEYDNVVSQMQYQYQQRLQAYKKSDKVFEKGFIAMVALSESGRKTQCQFDNGWLYLIGQ
ncbi:MAG: hypothetical protein QY306_15185 [Anaerolineales bacterium]|nr:MAG: hypothetical protein QY306_15185 [Anaerolineales bacterium]